MPITLSATEARVRFGELLRIVGETNEPVTVEKYGQPAAILLSPDLCRQLIGINEAEWQQLLRESDRFFARLLEADVSSD